MSPSLVPYHGFVLQPPLARLISSRSSYLSTLMYQERAMTEGSNQLERIALFDGIYAAFSTSEAAPPVR